MPPVPATLLTPEGIRARFQQPPIWTPEVTDENRFHGLDSSTFRPAAVLVPLILRPHGLSVMLTQRTAHLRSHAGQIAFPGGRWESSDASLIDTALREAEEETGLPPDCVQVLGTLPDYLTVSGFRVTPVVGLARPDRPFVHDPGEVAEIFEVPLPYLMDPAHHRVHTVQAESSVRRYYSMPYERFFIWGATAGMLRNLYHFLRAPDITQVSK